MAEYVITRFFLGMSGVRHEQERQVEENFFTFASQNPMLLPVLLAVMLIPLEAGHII